MHNKVIDKTGHKVSDSNRDVSESGSAAKVQPGQPPGPGNEAATTRAADTVVLTERGQLLERLERTAAALPTVDQARVAAVKADIASGNYQIDAENIADVLLRTDSEIGD